MWNALAANSIFNQAWIRFIFALQPDGDACEFDAGKSFHQPATPEPAVEKQRQSEFTRTSATGSDFPLQSSNCSPPILSKIYQSTWGILLPVNQKVLGREIQMVFIFAEHPDWIIQVLYLETNIGTNT